MKTLDKLVETDALGLTRQRTAVLSVIRSTEKHLTANEVFEAAREILPNISFATVYNSLKFLKQEGLIGELTFGNNAARYDRFTERHDHALCNDCGNLTDIDMSIPQDFIDKASKLTKFKPESIVFTLRGTCPECV